MEHINQQLEQSQQEEGAQYLSFTIDQKEYAINMMLVREVKGWTAVTRLPNKPSYMLGVLNLRGVIIPIFDVRARFGFARTEANAKHVIIIIMVGSRTVGMLVDAVADILLVKPSDIKPSPSADHQGQQAFVSGLLALPDRMVSLLNIDSIVGSTAAKAA